MSGPGPDQGPRERVIPGRRVLLTRRQSESRLADRLTQLGAQVFELPAIEIAPPEDFGPLDAALGRLDRLDWIAFTSANAVRAVAERLQALGRELPGPPRTVRIACVGGATARAVADCLRGAVVDLQPEADFRAAGLLAAFVALGGIDGQRILLPVGDRARDELSVGLRAQGARVETAVAYRTVMPSGLRDQLAASLIQGVDLVVFASPSAVENCLAAGLPTGLPAVAMGPTTEQSARAAGFTVLAVAAPANEAGLLAAVLQALEARGAECNQ